MQSYGLKIQSPYNIESFRETVISNASGNIVLTDSGRYIIRCIGDTYLSHNLANSLFHITMISEADGLNLEIFSSGIVDNDSVSDIYHKIIAANSNIKSRIKVSGATKGNSKIIYRSSLEAFENSSGTGYQNAKFLHMSDRSEIDAEPSLDIRSKNYPTSHSVSVSYPDKSKLWYLSIRGYDKTEGEEEILNGFLN